MSFAAIKVNDAPTPDDVIAASIVMSPRSLRPDGPETLFDPTVLDALAVEIVTEDPASRTVLM